ncbi:hypothetical protein JG687_00007342 [Phytophthora cactorum]|uniref:Uncharacterized protein n=1 Tax=Phytophthora cactorum TaxID=29920 RepID=A0A8T1UK01_9STRA|nr:hypothetical protein JG687_00007342 [Phytophthora cactorum]
MQALVDARMGTNTTKRPDIVLPKSFRQDLASQQRAEREKAELEHKRLVTAVQSQALYIENLCAIPRERLHKRIIILVGKRGKSRITSGFVLSPRIQLCSRRTLKNEDCYARMNEVFGDWGMESLPMAESNSVHGYSPETGAEYTQCVYSNSTMKPPAGFCGMTRTCRIASTIARSTSM